MSTYGLNLLIDDTVDHTKGIHLQLDTLGGTVTDGLVLLIEIVVEAFGCQISAESPIRLGKPAWTIVPSITSLISSVLLVSEGKNTSQSTS